MNNDQLPDATSSTGIVHAKVTHKISSGQEMTETDREKFTRMAVESVIDRFDPDPELSVAETNLQVVRGLLLCGLSDEEASAGFQLYMERRYQVHVDPSRIALILKTAAGDTGTSPFAR